MTRKPHSTGISSTPSPRAASAGSEAGAPDFPRPLAARRLWPAALVALAGLALIPFCGAFYPPFYTFLTKLPLDEFFSTAKQLVGTTALVTLALLIGGFDPRRRRALGVLLLALAISSAANEVLKRGLGRARPQYSLRLEDDKAEDLREYIAKHPGTSVRVERKDQWLLWRLPRPWFLDAFASFPSGHANAAFVLCAFLIALYPRGRWLWVVLFAGCALARVRYRRHFPSDILVGGAMGWMIAQWVMRWPPAAALAARVFDAEGRFLLWKK